VRDAAEPYCSVMAAWTRDDYLYFIDKHAAATA
jgi:hypothetical protein